MLQVGLVVRRLRQGRPSAAVFVAGVVEISLLGIAPPRKVSSLEMRSLVRFTKPDSKCAPQSSVTDRRGIAAAGLHRCLLNCVRVALASLGDGGGGVRVRRTIRGRADDDRRMEIRRLKCPSAVDAAWIVFLPERMNGSMRFHEFNSSPMCSMFVKRKERGGKFITCAFTTDTKSRKCIFPLKNSGMKASILAIVMGEV